MITDKVLRDKTQEILSNGNINAICNVSDPSEYTELPLVAIYTTSSVSKGEIKANNVFSTTRILELDILVETNDNTWADQLDELHLAIIQLLFNDDVWMDYAGAIIEKHFIKDGGSGEKSFGLGRLIIHLHDMETI